MYNPYARMYDAVMTVFRWEEVEKDGYTRQEMGVIADEVPCRYSSSGQVSVGVPSPALQNGHTLFCGLETDIREGDRVRITLRSGKAVEAAVGECHPYTYQWQCHVERDEDA